jgi:hypothetical protein
MYNIITTLKKFDRTAFYNQANLSMIFVFESLRDTSIFLYFLCFTIIQDFRLGIGLTVL